MDDKLLNATAKIRRRYNRITDPPRIGGRGGHGEEHAALSADVSVTAIDFSSRILARARHKAWQMNQSMDLLQMDVQRLDFAHAGKPLFPITDSPAGRK